MEVAFDPPAGLVSGGHDLGAGGRQLLAAELQQPAMVLKLASSIPISPTPRSGMRAPRSPPASRPAIAAARRTGCTIARVR